MIIGRATLFALALIGILGVASAQAAEPPCDLTPRVQCFGLESLGASLSTTQAGDHPDLTFTFGVKQDPETPPNVFGLKDAYSPTRNVRIELPPGLLGDPNVLGVPQQCTVQELLSFGDPSGGCPNGSQIGVTRVFAYSLNDVLLEPLYMMEPPGGDVVARIGFIAGLFPTYIDLKVRSESDYGITAEIIDATAEAKLIKSEATTWGVPSHPSHNTERCTPQEVLSSGCKISVSRPPGSRPLAFLTNPTRCGVPLEMRVGVASWAEPSRFDTKSASFPEISGCNRLPFGPGLTVEPTNRHAAAPTGLDVTLSLPASEGVDVLEPAQMRDIRVTLPAGLTTNPAVGTGLDVCSREQVRFEERDASQCPDAAKLADTEFDIAAFPRRMKGAIYLREPEPGNPFRIWVVADDLGAHVKLPGQLNVDRSTGQIESVVLDAPQAPVREVKLVFKSGFRAPLVNPSSCGTYHTHYKFVPWSGGPAQEGDTPMAITEGCNSTGGFDPKLVAGATDASAGQHSPFLFTLTRQDGEQNVKDLDIALPQGLAATFADIPRCVGIAAESGNCPPGSRIGKVAAAVGAGPTPLWVPEAGKRPTAIYLSGPYRGAPIGIVAVVPRQAGPFDFGDEVVRSAITVDPITGRATAHTDPLPQLIEGIPIGYRKIHVELDRPGFTLNPTSCARKATDATLISPAGAIAQPSSPFSAADCGSLAFKPRMSFRLSGGTRRSAHPGLRAIIRPRLGDANIGAFSVALPRSEFLDQGSIRTVCTRVQFAADQCPAGAIYGRVRAITPLFDEQLSGPIYLRSSNNPLPDMVAVLKGPASLPVEVNAIGRIDSIDGGIRTTFKTVPDAPITKVIATFPGGKDGLLENSTNLCTKTQRATAKLTGQNGLRSTLHPRMQVSCRKK